MFQNACRGGRSHGQLLARADKLTTPAKNVQVSRSPSKRTSHAKNITTPFTRYPLDLFKPAVSRYLKPGTQNCYRNVYLQIHSLLK